MIDDMVKFQTVEELRQYLSKKLEPYKTKLFQKERLNQLNVLINKYYKDNLDLATTLKVVKKHLESETKTETDLQKEYNDYSNELNHLIKNIETEQHYNDYYKFLLEQLE